MTSLKLMTSSQLHALSEMSSYATRINVNGGVKFVNGLVINEANGLH